MIDSKVEYSNTSDWIILYSKVLFFQSGQVRKGVLVGERITAEFFSVFLKTRHDIFSVK